MGSLIMRPSWSLTIFPALGTHFLKLAGHIQLQYVNLTLFFFMVHLVLFSCYLLEAYYFIIKDCK